MPAQADLMSSLNAAVSMLRKLRLAITDVSTDGFNAFNVSSVRSGVWINDNRRYQVTSVVTCHQVQCVSGCVSR